MKKNLQKFLCGFLLCIFCLLTAVMAIFAVRLLIAIPQYSGYTVLLLFLTAIICIAAFIFSIWFIGAQVWSITRFAKKGE